MVACGQCGRENRPESQFCTFCGSSLKLAQIARLQLTWALGQQDFPINKAEYYVGRDESNDFILNDPEVSGRHLKVICKDETYWIEDLNSRNGTFVNGERWVEMRKLNSGDLIKVGRSMLTFVV